MQDRVRECEGLPVIMNQCVIDERNPCTPFKSLFDISLTPILTDLREHAILALHNLLEDNPENQAVVDGYQKAEQ